MRVEPRGRREGLAAWLFLLPNLSGFLAFTLLPVLASLVLAFTEWNILNSPKFVGLQNFTRLLGYHRGLDGREANDPQFWHFLFNTLYFMIGIPFSMAGSLLLAAAFNRKLRHGSKFFQIVYFLPSVCPGVAIALLWKWLYNTDAGLINHYAAAAGHWFGRDWGNIGWLTDPGLAKASLMFMGFWGAVGGGNAMLYLAALQNVPKSYYEAAEMDGAGPVRRFFSITVPMVSSTTFFIGIMSFIAGFQGGFMTAYVMTSGGPNGSTTTLEYYIFQNGFTWLRMGYASAVAWVVFLMVLVATLIGWMWGGKRVVYT